MKAERSHINVFKSELKTRELPHYDNVSLARLGATEWLDNFMHETLRERICEFLTLDLSNKLLDQLINSKSMLYILDLEEPNL